jgi:TPR repeat protein
MKSIFKLILVVMFIMMSAACVPKKTKDTPLKAQTGYKMGIESFKKQDYKTAYTNLYPLAVEGDDEAQYAVGYMLYYGKTGTANPPEGMDWIRRSATQGNPLAQRALGIFYAQANMTPEKPA